MVRTHRIETLDGKVIEASAEFDHIPDTDPEHGGLARVVDQGSVLRVNLGDGFDKNYKYIPKKDIAAHTVYEKSA